MSAKTLQARVNCLTDSDYTHDQKLRFLWITHRLFNQCLNPVIATMMQMKRGKDGPLAEKYSPEIAEKLTVAFQYMMQSGGQRAHAVMEPLTGGASKGGKKDTKGKGAPLARALRSKGVCLFDRYQLFPLSSSIWRKLFQLAARVIHGHIEKVSTRREERNEWESGRKEWLKQNKEFWESAYPKFQQFEKENGFPHGVNRREYTRGHKLKQFIESNPELDEHVKSLLFYNAVFRPEKKPRQITFTLPNVRRALKDTSAKRLREHPIWMEFQKDVLYRDLDPVNGTVRLLVFIPNHNNTSPDLQADKLDPSDFNPVWLQYSFKPDPRISNIESGATIEQKGNRKFSLTYSLPDMPDPENPDVPLVLPAEIRGIKLIFKKDIPYFYFTLDLLDRELPKDIKWDPKANRRELPDNIKTVAIDLGQRHTACATLVSRQDGAFSPEPEVTHFIRVPGVELPALMVHQQQLSRNISKMTTGTKGRARWLKRGSRSFVSLRQHLANMKEDRFKKAAHEIVTFAAKHGARVIVFERLKGFRPEVENPRVVNLNLMNWNRRKVVEFVEILARPLGISVRTVPPYWSSSICYKCQSPGARFSRVTKKEAATPWGKTHNLTPKYPWVRRGGKLFCCSNPKCAQVVNADFNAAMNLQRLFHGHWHPPDHKPDWKDIRFRVQEMLENKFPTISL